MATKNGTVDGAVRRDGEAASLPHRPVVAPHQRQSGRNRVHRLGGAGGIERARPVVQRQRMVLGQRSAGARAGGSRPSDQRSPLPVARAGTVEASGRRRSGERLAPSRGRRARRPNMQHPGRGVASASNRASASFQMSRGLVVRHRVGDHFSGARAMHIGIPERAHRRAGRTIASAGCPVCGAMARSVRRWLRGRDRGRRIQGAGTLQGLDGAAVLLAIGVGRRAAAASLDPGFLAALACHALSTSTAGRARGPVSLRVRSRTAIRRPGRRQEAGGGRDEDMASPAERRKHRHTTRCQGHVQRRGRTVLHRLEYLSRLRSTRAYQRRSGALAGSLPRSRANPLR